MQNGSSWTSAEVLLGLAFVPLVLVAAWIWLWRARPKAYPPVLFFAIGTITLVLGAHSAFELRSALRSGVFELPRRLGGFHAELAHEPLAFWCLVLGYYGFWVFGSGLGLATIAWAFMRKPGG